METNVPQLVVKKLSSTNKNIAETKVQFIIEEFMEYGKNEEINEEISTREDLECSIKLCPFSVIDDKSYLVVGIKGFNEMIWKSKKHQLKVTVSVEDYVVADSGLKNIDHQNVWQALNVYIDRSSLSERLTGDGSLVLVISIEIFGPDSSSPLSKTIEPSIILNNNFEVATLNSRILESGAYSDFTIIVQQQNFKVHRSILAAASPVFDKMFSNEMVESKSDQCEVKEIKPHIFKHLLEFIYTAKVPKDISDVAKELFEAAHYYEIEKLKEICENELPRKLTVKNALETYKWAWIYDLEELKLAAWKIIKKDIIKDDGLEANKTPPANILEEILACKNKLQELYGKV